MTSDPIFYPRAGGVDPLIVQFYSYTPVPKTILAGFFHFALFGVVYSIYGEIIDYERLIIYGEMK